MKPLKPSMREKKRYLLLKGEHLRENVEKAIFEFVGVLGMSKTGLSWIKANKKSGIICINREALNFVRASFAVYPKEISVERVSGTLKSLRNKGKIK